MAILFASNQPSVAKADKDEISGVPGTHSTAAVVNMGQLARQEALSPPAPTQSDPVTPYMPMPDFPPSGETVTTSLAPSNTKDSLSTFNAILGANFAALGDNNTIIPPDTHGAVGPNHLMTVLNTEIRIQDRTGAIISTVSLNSFWAGVNGGSGAFDDKVLYDPFQGRWMITGCDDARLSTSGLLIAVSQTNDPTGIWNIFKVNLGNASDWLDYPSLGFNKDWIVVNVNEFTISGGSFVGTRFYVFNKAALYNNVTPAATHTVINDTTDGGTIVPALTYDNTLNGIYLLQNWSGAGGQLQLYAITGLIGSEILSPVGFVTAPNSQNWNTNSPNDFAPQSGIARGIMTNDARIQNVVYRNGALWTTQHVFLPAASPTRSSVQWWQVGTTGNVLQFGRIDDISGVSFYAYPTLAVNARNDMMLGYTRFSANQFASANYSYRLNNDPTNTLRADNVLKAGEGAYNRDSTGTRNRWGDYSNTIVDPTNDVDMWTIQEYAATASPPGSIVDDSGRWGTWWGKLSIPVSVAVVTGSLQLAPVTTAYSNALQVVVKDSNNNLMPGVTVTFSATVGTTGASAIFPGGLVSGTATTNVSGIATSPVITANCLVGTFTVLGTVGGITNSAVFTLTNIANTNGKCNINLLPSTYRLATTQNNPNAKLTATGVTPTISDTSTVRLTAWGLGNIPNTATGLVGVLTNIECTGGANFRFWTGGTAPTAANLNVPGANFNLNLSTGFTAPLDAEGKVYLGLASGVPTACGYIVDVLGYITGTSGGGNNISLLSSTYRLATTQNNAAPKLASTGLNPTVGLSSTVQLSAGGQGGIPTNATGIVGVLTNIECTGGANFRFWTGATPPTAANLNVPGANPQLNLSTNFIAPLDNQGKVYLGLGSGAATSCGYVLDVVGYLSPLGTSSDLALLPGTKRVATTQNNALPKLFSTGITPTIGLTSTVQVVTTPADGIPTTAKGVVGILTNIECTGGANFRFWTAGIAPLASNLNIPGAFPQLNLSSGFVAPLDGTGKVYLGLGSGAPNSCGYVIDIVAYVT